MKKTVIILSALAVGMLIIHDATAQRPQRRGKGQRPTPEMVIDRLDSNEDGKLSLEEAKKGPRGRLAQNFENLDADKDGFVTLEELKNRPRKGQGRRN